MVGKNTRRSFHLLVGATLTIATSVVGSFLTSSLTSGEQSWWLRLGWLAAGIALTYFYLRWQLRSQEESPEAIKERVSQLEPELRSQVQSRSYGARSKLIEAPLRELELDITPRLGLVRDPRLIEPEPISEQIADDVVAAFESFKRRLLIVGEPGSGKTIAAYSLIEYLDDTEGDRRIPLLVNLSAWEAQEDFEAFLVDYLCSSVGYEVHERAVASAFIDSDRYSLILDGLDEIAVALRTHFSERLDEFVRRLPVEVGVIVTCRTQEYQELRADYPTGLGLVQAVEILPLTDQQLDCAFVELAKDEKDWELFLSERDLTAYQRVRQLLSNPLFLNLAVAGRLSPSQLLDWTTTEQELQDRVLDSYLDRTLTDQTQYEPEDARRCLTWVARFLSGAEVSPFGLKTTDSTVFDLANLTPPEPPRRYRLFEALGLGLIGGLVAGLFGEAAFWGVAVVWGVVGGLVFGLAAGLVGGLFGGLLFGLLSGLAFGLTEGMVSALYGALTWGLVGGFTALLTGGRHHDRSAVSSHLTPVWPPNRERLHDFLRVLGLGLAGGAVFGMLFGLLILGLAAGPVERLTVGVVEGMLRGMGVGLSFGLFGGLFGGLAAMLEPQTMLITSRTPKEASSRSLIAALVFGLAGGLTWGLAVGLFSGLFGSMEFGLALGLAGGLVVGLGVGLARGAWFVLLQKVAHHRLARSGSLPLPPYDFLEWGVYRQIFRRVGGGVRFRHNLIQQHLANALEGAR
jgi:hypothetical protein